MKRQLHPGARWLFRINSYILIAVATVFFGVWLFTGFVGFFMDEGTDTVQPGMLIGFIFGWIGFVIIASEVYARMAYNRWFYEFTPESLRLERGIIWKSYSNVPYERIQNVDIHRGIIARVFGFSTVAMQTAGYSAQAHAEGSLPAVGVQEAEEIRSFVMKRISEHRKH